jgi:hypothetical protein
MKNRLKKNWWLGVLVLVGVSLVIKLSLIVTGRFVFSWDFARDMLWLRKLTVAHELMLVGAWGSLQGTLFGALYFYLLMISSLFLPGDPRGAVVMVAVLLSLIPLIVFWWSKRWFGRQLSLIWVSLFVLSPYLFRLSIYSFPQQLVPLIFLGFFIFQWEMLFAKSHTQIWLFLLGITAGLLFHFEPANAPAALLLGLMLGAWKMKGAKSSLRWAAFLIYGSGSLIPLLPNILYDIRHGWIQLQGYIALLTGMDESLGGYLPLGERVIDRLQKFGHALTGSLFEPQWVGVAALVLLIGAVLFLYKRQLLEIKRSETRLLLLLGVNVLFQLVYFIAFSRLLKDYYLHFFPILAVLGGGLCLNWLWLGGLKKYVVGWMVLMGVMLVMFVNTLWQSPGDAQEYRVQQQVVDWVYKQAQGEPFKVYTYTPLVHDYPYQYLFSWYGNKRYGA